VAGVGAETGGVGVDDAGLIAVGVVLVAGFEAQRIDDFGQAPQLVVAALAGLAVGVGDADGFAAQVVFRFRAPAVAVDDRCFTVHRVVFVLGGMAVGVGNFSQVAGFVVGELRGLAQYVGGADAAIGGIVLMGGVGTDDVTAAGGGAAGFGGAGGIPSFFLSHLAVGVEDGFLDAAFGIGDLDGPIQRVIFIGGGQRQQGGVGRRSAAVKSLGLFPAQCVVSKMGVQRLPGTRDVDVGHLQAVAAGFVAIGGDALAGGVTRFQVFGQRSQGAVGVPAIIV